MPANQDTIAANKQKMKAAGAVIAVLVVIWQAYGMFFGGSSAPSSPTPPKSIANTPASAMQSSTATSATPSLPSSTPTMTEANLPKNLPLTQSEQATQNEYIDQLNKLELLRIQRQIAETNQAIVAAKLATVTTERNIDDIVRPTTNVFPPSNLNASLSQQPAGPPENIQLPLPKSTPKITPQVTYTLQSVSSADNKWSAVITYKSKQYIVSVGDILPADDSVVEKINESSVILKKDGETRTLTFVPTSL